VETIREYAGGEDPRPALDENIFTRAAVEPPATQPNPNGPYVITEEEYNHNEVGYTQVSLTYYAGDDILCDDNDAPILEVDEVIGDALNHFGYGTDNINMVFVRNSRTKLDMEIVKSAGHFSVEVADVAGSNAHLAHSAERIPRRRYNREE
jgi:hypothetical protein